MISPASFKRRQLRAARILLGWSQAELGRRSGVHFDTIGDYERGQRAKMHPKKLARVTHVLAEAGVTLTANGIEYQRDRHNGSETDNRCIAVNRQASQE